MGVRSFLRRVKPGRPVSQLVPHLKDIQQLRDKGYTLTQVCQYLAEQGVEVTPAGVSVFLKRLGRTSPARRRIAKLGR